MAALRPFESLGDQVSCAIEEATLRYRTPRIQKAGYKRQDTKGRIQKAGYKRAGQKTVESEPSFALTEM
jgi:hypothetical protein